MIIGSVSGFEKAPHENKRKTKGEGKKYPFAAQIRKISEVTEGIIKLYMPIHNGLEITSMKTIQASINEP